MTIFIILFFNNYLLLAERDTKKNNLEKQKTGVYTFFRVRLYVLFKILKKGYYIAQRNYCTIIDLISKFHVAVLVKVFWIFHSGFC